MEVRLLPGVPVVQRRQPSRRHDLRCVPRDRSMFPVRPAGGRSEVKATAEEDQAVIVFDTHERLSALIHGDTKLGKSTLANTAPKPCLVLDAEGSWRFTIGRKIYWNP